VAEVLASCRDNCVRAAQPLRGEREHDVVGIEGIDTRALVRKLRITGALKGVLSTVDLNDQSLVAKAKLSPGLVGRDLVREVMPTQPREWQENLNHWMKLEKDQPLADDAGKPHIVALDYGMKWNIPRYLRDRNFRVTILPGTATSSDVLAANPDGVFLSNGPGDP